VGSRFRGTEDEVRALSALINLARAAELMASHQSRNVADDGLTLSQFGVLETLHHLGPLSQKELSEKLLKTSGNMTMVVTNLEKRNLVSRERRKDDRRCNRVGLTARGRRLIRRVMPAVVKSITADMSRLTQAEQGQLRRLCRKLGKQEES